MDFHSSHPLDNITRNNPYSMLEALIPFVDYPLKLPLALLVKYYEVRLILNAFQSTDTLSRYGLHNTSSDPMEMLGNVMGISPEMLKTLMSLMESQNTYGSYDNDFNYYEQSRNSFESTDNLDDNIKNIFAEYDMLQAAEYSEEKLFSCDQPDSDIEYKSYDKNNENSQKNTEPEYYI